jgi:hypothetical protein
MNLTKEKDMSEEIVRCRTVASSPYDFARQYGPVLTAA